MVGIKKSLKFHFTSMFAPIYSTFMKNKLYLYLLPCIVFIQCCAKKEPEIDKYSEVPIRQPAVAGQFYSADSSKLTQALDAFFEDAVALPVGKPLAIVVPHAGYIFSGQIATDAFNQVQNHKYDVIVILGTNHTTPGFNGISIYPRGGYLTPLGLAKIDEQIAISLIETNEEYTFSPEVHEHEHSVEVQIPFIQYLFPGTKIVPVVIGKPELDLCVNFGRVLAGTLKNRRVLIVASSDLSHYPTYSNALDVDTKTLETIVELNPSKLQSVLRDQMVRNIPNLVTGACGEAPILTAIEAAKVLGATCGTVVSYANSGDISIGNRNRVVGYGAVAITRDENCVSNEATINPPTDGQSDVLLDSHKKELLAFARETISQFLTTETVPLARGFDPGLKQKMGAFVTLKKGHELRGCIGHMNNDLPLCDVIGSMALQAAFNDRRFFPVTLDELEEIDIEISLLTPYKPIKSANDIVLGQDGVALKKGNHQAVFLPQVASEQEWNRNELLDNLCKKAGLTEGCWFEDAQLFTFQAIVFHEMEL